MSACEKRFGAIEDLIEGELDERAARSINAHAAVCPACRAKYETLKREKEIYAHYLFDAEPPPDLWADFAARLAAEREDLPARAPKPVGLFRRTTNVFGFLRPWPALGIVLFLVWALGPLRPERAPVAENSGGHPAANVDRPLLPDPRAARDLPAGPESGQKLAAKNDETVFKNRRKPNAAENALSRLKAFSPKALSPSETKKPSDKRPPAGDELTTTPAKNIENDIAAQIEKLELLLRSFRNARPAVGVENFDIAYERVQARRLLEKNARLRRDAENYGIFYAGELLGRAEPYLLDIANLEPDPTPEKVLGIVERVSRQNIIASLQVYGRAATR